MKSGWAYCFACLALLCASCIPPRLSASDGAAPDAAPDAVAPDAASDGPPPEAAADGAGEERAMGGRLVLTVTADENDALWINGKDERLHYSATNPSIEVGLDSEIGRTGLRFQVPVPARAIIASAKIGLARHSGELDLSSNMTVQIYDSVNVAPFSDLHEHLPEEHDPRQLWGNAVKGFMVCDSGQICASPDLAELVQRIVNKAEWTGTGWIGFVLAPDDTFTPNGWIAFQDSSAGVDPPSLEIVYAPPPP